MKIAVIGTGNVGGTLGAAWVRTGHQVVFGTRGESAESALADAGAAPVAQATKDAEVLVVGGSLGCGAGSSRTNQGLVWKDTD